MKKHAAFLSLCFVALLALAACGGNSGRAGDAADSFTAAVTNRAEEEILGLHLEYRIGGEPLGGGEVLLANGGPVPAGETLLWTFGPENFPPETDPSDFSMEIFVILPDRSQVPCGGLISFAARYGEEYAYTLLGDFHQGFSLTAEES